MPLKIALALQLPALGSGDGDPVGISNNIVQEDGISLILQEDGVSTLLKE